MLLQMKKLDFSNQALILKNEAPQNIPYVFDGDAIKEIDLISATPTKLSYSFSASEDQLVVFSEIYYPNGWYAEIDGKVVNHFPVNYVLRGMLVPAGKHTISFRFEPQVIKLGVRIRMISLLVFLLIASYFVYHKIKNRINGHYS